MNNPNKLQEMLINDGYVQHQTPDRVPVVVLVNLEKMQAAFFQGKRKKPNWHYRFNSLEELFNRVRTEVDTVFKAVKDKAEKKAKEKEEAVAIRAAVQVGDLYVSSWGWEQTNIDFYQVVDKPSPATVIVRPIARKSTYRTCGYDSEYCKPDKDNFIGEPSKFRLDNQGDFKISSFQWARKTNAEKEHYRSWYA